MRNTTITDYLFLMFVAWGSSKIIEMEYLFILPQNKHYLYLPKNYSNNGGRSKENDLGTYHAYPFHFPCLPTLLLSYNIFINCNMYFNIERGLYVLKLGFQWIPPSFKSPLSQYPFRRIFLEKKKHNCYICCKYI